MSIATTEESRLAKIAQLNDRCRHGLDRTARIVITRTCAAAFEKETKAATILAQAELFGAIRKYQFPDDDRSERNRGSIEFGDTTVYFAIDAYDLKLEWGSEDPADASITRRVMTIMLREDQ